MKTSKKGWMSECDLPDLIYWKLFFRIRVAEAYLTKEFSSLMGGHTSKCINHENPFTLVLKPFIDLRVCFRKKCHSVKTSVGVTWKVLIYFALWETMLCCYDNSYMTGSFWIYTCTHTYTHTVTCIFIYTQPIQKIFIFLGTDYSCE